MSRQERLLEVLLRGRSDANIRFSRLCRLMRYLGFEERVRGSHHIFDMDGVAEIVCLQTQQGHAKPYQVKQVRQLICKYTLGKEG